MVQDFTPQAKLQGTWKGKRVSMPKTLLGHELTQDEFDRLCDGETIHFDATSKEGHPYVACGSLGKRTFTGNDGKQHTTTGFVFRDIPYECCGHVFTDAEVKDLESGKTIRADDLVSRRTGATFSADLFYGRRDDGKDGIVFKFDDSRKGSNPKDYYSGVYMGADEEKSGQEVRFRRIFFGKRLDDDTCDELLAGAEVTVNGLVSKTTGKEYAVKAKLGWDEWNGKRIFGVVKTGWAD